MSRPLAPVDLTFSADPPASVRAALQKSLWRPIYAGLAFVAVFIAVMCAGTLFEISGAVVAKSFVRVEAKVKTIKHLDGGIIKKVLVRDGDKVEAGQLLVIFDDTQPKAQVDVLRSQHNSFVAQRARFAAERDQNASIVFPDELLSGRDPNALVLMRDQENLFKARTTAIEGQTGILRQRMEQLQARKAGLRAQISANERQVALIREELVGLTSLYEKGYAPKTRMLQLQRTAAELDGARASYTSEIARADEQIGETELQLASLHQQRQSEAAEGFRDVQSRINELLPRLRAAEEVLARVEVVAPSSGYVLNSTQFPEGGVAGPGERLLDIVPADTPLVFEARVRPDDIDDVAAGMPSRIQLFPAKARTLPTMDAEVVTVSADRITDTRTGEPYFQADVRLKPGELAKLGSELKLYPGMPATVMIVTGSRTIIAYLFAPILNSLNQAMRER